MLRTCVLAVHTLITSGAAIWPGSLVRALLYVDEAGVLWRVRTWSDPAVGAAWFTQEDLGAFNQA
jgi:hypothetical protein